MARYTGANHADWLISDFVKEFKRRVELGLRLELPWVLAKFTQGFAYRWLLCDVKCYNFLLLLLLYRLPLIHRWVYPWQKFDLGLNSAFF